MRTGTALLVATGLVALAAALLAGSGAPGDVFAVAGGISAAVAVALLVLTGLAAWWRGTEAPFTTTVMDPLYDDLASSELFDDAGSGDDGRAAAG